MVVFSEKRTGVGGGFGGLTTDPEPGRHIPAESGTLHHHHPENIKPMFYKRSRNLLLRLREVKEKIRRILAVPKSVPENGIVHNFHV